MSKGKVMKQARHSIFFDCDENTDTFETWDNVEIRACVNDDDYPIEVSVEIEDGRTVGFAFSKADIHRFIAEAYSTGKV